MRTKRVLRAAVAFLFAFGVLAADLTPLRLPPQTASAVTQADIDKLKKESNALSSKKINFLPFICILPEFLLTLFIVEL